MSVTNGFLHTCTIAPREYGAIDADRHPVVQYGTPVEDVPCRLMERDERVIVNGGVNAAVRYDKRLQVGPEVAIRTLDRVSDVQGAWDDPGPYIVQEVHIRQNMSAVVFKTAYLMRVGGAQ